MAGIDQEDEIDLLDSAGKNVNDLKDCSVATYSILRPRNDIVPYEDRAEDFASQTLAPVLNETSNQRNSADVNASSKTLLTQTKHARVSQDATATASPDRFQNSQVK